jgi:hypothetical protein
MDNQIDTDGIIFAAGSVAGAISAQNVSNFVSAPLLGCSLSNCEKLVPKFT